MLDALLPSRTMKSITLAALTSRPVRAKLSVSSDRLNSPRQACSAASADCGSSEVW